MFENNRLTLSQSTVVNKNCCQCNISTYKMLVWWYYIWQGSGWGWVQCYNESLRWKNATVNSVVQTWNENIDQIRQNKLHGPMHYKIGVTCEYNGHVFYTLL